MSPSVEVNGQPESGDIWTKKYADALHEIMRLQEELSAKDDQIKTLTKTIVEMKLELATAKATQDDLGMRLRRTSIVEDGSVIEKAMAEKKDERRASRRAHRDSTGEHSNSIAVQNPSAHKKTRPVVPRNKSESWALRTSEIDEDKKLDESLNAKLPLRSFRLGWGLESELDDSRTERRSSESTRGAEEEKKIDVPPRRGLGSFIRGISHGNNIANTIDKNVSSSPEKMMTEKVPVEGNDAYSLRRPTSKAREELDLTCSCVVFPVESSDLLTAFLEENGKFSKDSRRRIFSYNGSESQNEEWLSM
jgi:hypothetical protein